jgi:hypothetical protein
VKMMFCFYRGDWQLTMRSLRVGPSFSDSSVESLSVQGCREKAESSCFGHQVVLLTRLVKLLLSNRCFVKQLMSTVQTLDYKSCSDNYLLNLLILHPSLSTMTKGVFMSEVLSFTF